MRAPHRQKVSATALEEAGWVEAMTVAAGKAVLFWTDEYPGGSHHPGLDMVKGLSIAAAPPPPPPESPKSCTVDGVQVDELAVLVKPVAFFVTTEHGTHEVSRCYFQKGKFQYGVDMQRLGGVGTRSAEYQPGRGLLIHFDHGYEMFIPMSHCQATWRLPEST